MSWSRMRWPEFEFWTPSSIFRWRVGIDLSHLSFGWSSQSFRSWLDFSVDNLLWTFVTVFETLAVLAMLCYFFIFCGCTL
ncbi:hypothetical protein LOK49_LG08G03365 [Camellia lanceoleosa]|uniref:Uncharacterized protein n=1 Tax=Camellia lanceoleosa TaxID=1840588 RepID=A0ACC0GUU6_9ERIC|nr:hypothetical protein LOK49_LG08G03365 [Camellia lanceoleosa]